MTDDIYSAAAAPVEGSTTPDFGSSRAAVEKRSVSEPRASTAPTSVQRERKLSHAETPRHKFQLSAASPEFSPSQKSSANPFVSALTAASPEFRPRLVKDNLSFSYDALY